MIGAGHFDAYAVQSRSGPHVTLQAGVVHLGRYWTTTTRHSVKAASIRRMGRSAATIGDDGRWRLVGGPSSVLDPAHPTTIVADPISAMMAGGALLRLGLGRLDQLVGYAEAASAVPLSFLPPGRVLLVTRLRDELLVDHHRVVSAIGAWAEGSVDYRPGGKRAPRWQPERALAGVPEDVAALALQDGRGWLGTQTSAGSVALPGHWEPSTGRLQVARAALSSVAAELPGAVCVTLDDSGSARPDRKLGLMLRGQGSVVDVDKTVVSVALEVAQVTYWQGFATATEGEAA